MGNLRQSMTEKEWNEMGHLVNIINTDNEPDLISKMLDNLPVANLDNFCDKKRIPDTIPDKNVSHPQHYGGADNPYEAINHPQHYGGVNNPYEAIKVIEAHDFDFITGNIVKYLFRHKKKNGFEDLKKAQWYMTRLVEREQKKQNLK